MNPHHMDSKLDPLLAAALHRWATQLHVGHSLPCRDVAEWYFGQGAHWRRPLFSWNGLTPLRSRVWWLRADGDMQTLVAMVIRSSNDRCWASVDVQMACLQQLASPALLLLGGSGVAARRGQSRDRHFARVFACTVVNAADADQCVSVAPHGHVLCTWLCGIHCVPRRGGTALSGMQLGTWARMALAAAARAAACALLACFFRLRFSSTRQPLYSRTCRLRAHPPLVVVLLLPRVHAVLL